MAEFEDESVEAALDRALGSATHLRASDAAAVAAARALARKIDAWDTIVDWAIEDAAESGTRPAVPANDNVSLSTFLKYVQALRLVPEESAAARSAGGAAQAPRDDLERFRSRHGIGGATG